MNPERDRYGTPIPGSFRRAIRREVKRAKKQRTQEAMENTFSASVLIIYGLMLVAVALMAFGVLPSNIPTP